MQILTKTQNLRSSSALLILSIILIQYYGRLRIKIIYHISNTGTEKTQEICPKQKTKTKYNRHRKRWRQSTEPPSGGYVAPQLVPDSLPACLGNKTPLKGYTKEAWTNLRHNLTCCILPIKFNIRLITMFYLIKLSLIQVANNSVDSWLSTQIELP